MIYFHPYTLYSRGSLNAVSVRREFHGALIRVDEGVGCLHPWPEFGDEPIDEQLSILRDGGTSRVIECALRMAAKAHADLYASIRQNGGTHRIIDRMQTRADLYATIGYHKYEALDTSIITSLVPEGMPQKRAQS